MYISLIIRMWNKHDDHPGILTGSWQIEVEHIQSGGHWEFSTIDDLECFLIDFMRQVNE